MRVRSKGFHFAQDIPNMLPQIMSFFDSRRLNIENTANTSRVDYTYTLIDIRSLIPQDMNIKLKAIDRVLSGRGLFERHA